MTILQNQPFTVQVQHDQVNTTSFELTHNGTVVDSKLADPVGINFQFPSGLPAGQHTFVVTAFGPGGSTASDPFVLNVTVAPPAKPVISINVNITVG